MSAAPRIDVRDLKSVRRAAAELRRRDEAAAGEVILGEDYVEPDSAADPGTRRRWAGVLTLNRSPLARRIVTFNLIALILLVAGMLYFAPARENLARQRISGLLAEATLIADVVEARLPSGAPVNFLAGDGISPEEALAGISLRSGVEAFLFDRDRNLIARQRADDAAIGPAIPPDDKNTILINLLNRGWDALAALVAGQGRIAPPAATADPVTAAASQIQPALAAGATVEGRTEIGGQSVFTVATPVLHNGQVVGAIALASAAGEIDALVRSEREQILKMFVVGMLVSIGLSLVLASTIANPIADLATAAEAGRDRDARRISPGRVRIPDLTARPDEIGRLSAAMRGMVAALYERIESNEQFAADVAHEIKNPLASLRSAVDTLRIARRDDQRAKLLDIIDQDVGRLDRLVTDISTASRLDSELVKEEERPFDLVTMLGNLGTHLGREAKEKGIDFITDLPARPITLHGLEGRLAQVFVNLIANAISFCEDGDAIRLWARKRDNRVLVVVEDTGPGIPEDALTRIFQRFYSERPAEHFGNNSGLGLAISKQIIEAHGGVIWAENIRPTEADLASEPLGARFVVGLPI